MENDLKNCEQEQTTGDKQSAGQPVTIDLREIVQPGGDGLPLDLIRIGSDETAIVPFTPKTIQVFLHYCSEREIGGYVLCNNEDCLLCRIGRKKDERYLLPVYAPAEQRVGIMPVSPSQRPFSLLAQLYPILQGDRPVVLLISRDGMKYTVSTHDLKPDMDAGEVQIKEFLESFNEGEMDLSAVYPKLDNTQLAMIGEIDRMMKMKGISIDEDTAA